MRLTPAKAILLVFTIALLSAAGTFFLLAAQQKQAATPPQMVPVGDNGDVFVYAEPLDNRNLEVIAKAPGFEMTNALGESFSSEALAGKVWIADFFFTACPGICPIMMGNMAKLADEFRGKPVEFVCFSVDPETDTPERMKQYGGKYGADPAVWHLLTGPIEETARLSREAFMLGDVEVPADHSARMVLVDHEGNIRGYFSGVDDDDQQNLVEAIEHLLEEIK